MTKIQRGAVLRTVGAYDSMITNRITVDSIAGAALAADETAILEVIVQNSPGSAVSVFVGNVTGQYIEIVAGANFTIPINDLSDVYVRTDGGTATVNWLAMT
ncbi:MAG: hypothetical protein ACYSW0_18495 [Planctomycetota bacterium]|jgi:hypothetical protein